MGEAGPLAGRLALVTGGSRGIGRGVVLELARLGADVALTCRRASGADEVAAAVRAMGRRCVVLEADASDAEALAALPAAIEGALKGSAGGSSGVSILVNNAGVTRDNLFLRMTPDEWCTVLQTNLDAVFRVTRAFIRGMVRQRYGRVVSIGSVVGLGGNAGQANYSASKAALVGLSRSLAQELGGRNVTCNVVAPGMIETDMTATLAAKQRAALLERIPLGRMGTVDEVAAVVGFLVGPGGDYINGAVLDVNGGLA